MRRGERSGHSFGEIREFLPLERAASCDALRQRLARDELEDHEGLVLVELRIDDLGHGVVTQGLERRDLAPQALGGHAIGLGIDKFQRGERAIPVLDQIHVTRAASAKRAHDGVTTHLIARGAHSPGHVLTLPGA